MRNVDAQNEFDNSRHAESNTTSNVATLKQSFENQLWSALDFSATECVCCSLGRSGTRQKPPFRSDSRSCTSGEEVGSFGAWRWLMRCQRQLRMLRKDRARMARTMPSSISRWAPKPDAGGRLSVRESTWTFQPGCPGEEEDFHAVPQQAAQSVTSSCSQQEEQPLLGI